MNNADAVYGQKWREEEIIYIKNHIVEKTADEIAAKLGRTPGAVRAFITRKRLILNRDNIEYKKRFERRQKKYGHLCWYCARSCGEAKIQCSWAAKLVPVSGWKTKIVPGYLIDGDKKVERFNVIACPLYLEG